MTYPRRSTEEFMLVQPAAEEHEHPPASTYVGIAAILAVITVVEVGVFYVPAFQSVLAPLLLVLSAGKFLLVVLFYMHLKFDHQLFSALFSIPLIIATGVMIALLFLFGVFALG